MIELGTAKIEPSSTVEPKFTLERGGMADPAAEVALAAKFGYEPCNSLASMWLYIPHGVYPHKDKGRRTLVYLYQGMGKLFTRVRDRIEELRMYPGYVYLFTSTREHFFIADDTSGPCIMYCCDVRRKV